MQDSRESFVYGVIVHGGEMKVERVEFVVRRYVQ